MEWTVAKTTTVIAYLVQLGLWDLREVVVLVVVPHIVGELVHRPIVRVRLLPLQWTTWMREHLLASYGRPTVPRHMQSVASLDLQMHWPIGVQGTAGTDRRRAHLHEHVVLGDEVAGHGVQAAAKHRARQQVHNRLEAAGVDHGGVKHHHDCNVDQIRGPYREQAGG